jgi:hypothetical protein
MLLLTIVGCSKDDDNNDNPLVGKWIYQKTNVIFYLDGDVFDAREEGEDLSDFDDEFRSLYFVFEKDGSVRGGQNGQSGEIGTYSVSGKQLSINDGESTVRFDYQITGNELEWIWDIDFMKANEYDIPDFFDDFDDVEIVLTFIRAD